MNISADQYFALIVPVTCLMLGSVLLVCGRFMRNQTCMMWLGAGYIAVAIALAAQCLMTNVQLARWSVACGVLYLAGSWATAHGVAMRYGRSVDWRGATLISAVTLSLLFYFSFVAEVLWMRMLSVNMGMALLLSMAVPAVVKAPAATFLVERLLRASYLVLVVYSLARQGILFWSIPVNPSEDLSRSGFWLLMLATNLMLNLTFLILLLASVLRELLHTLRHERNHDPLTHLLNRRAFFEHADELMQRNRRQRWALLACDLDHFKQLNDRHGHEAGDRMLEAAGQILVAQVRQGDLVCRFGGEEFLVLLRCSELREARTAAERMRQQLEQARLGDELALTASFGVVMVAPDEPLTSAIQRADTLMYEAKRTGRNRIIMEHGALA